MILLRLAGLTGDPYHDLSLAVGDGDIGGLDRVPGRGLHHGPELLNGFGRLGPEGVGPAVGRECCSIEVGEYAKGSELTRKTVPFCLSSFG